MMAFVGNYFDLKTDPTLFDRRDMSPLNELWYGYVYDYVLWTDPTLFDRRDMSLLNELQLCSRRSGSRISDASEPFDCLLCYPSSMMAGREVIICYVMEADSSLHV